MSLALDLARGQQGRTAENPSVGCVIVKDGEIVGQGVTSDGGRPHGEANALQVAGRAAKGVRLMLRWNLVPIMARRHLARTV